MNVEMISTIANVNCNTTSTLRGERSARVRRNCFLKIPTGLKAENKRRDNCPPTRLVNARNPTGQARRAGEPKRDSQVGTDQPPKGRKRNCTITRESPPEMTERSEMTSAMNWPISNPLPAPATFRIPTSFARFSLRAVLRFMKLIHAISRIKPRSGQTPSPYRCARRQELHHRTSNKGTSRAADRQNAARDHIDRY